MRTRYRYSFRPRTSRRIRAVLTPPSLSRFLPYWRRTLGITCEARGFVTARACRVGLGGCPPRPPTDPDVRVDASGSSGAQVRRTKLSAAVASRPGLGSVSDRPVPPAGPCPGAPLPSTGSLGRSPAFQVLSRHSDSPWPFPLCFVAFTQRYRDGVPLFAPTRGRNT